LSPEKMRLWLEHNAEIRNSECFNKTTGHRIKACVPMHTFGHPVKIDELIAVCTDWHIELVEDAAESIGSQYKGRHTGTFGKVGVLSFNGNKTITTGGGGMLLFMDETLGEYAKHLTTQAKVPHRWEFVHDQIGYNYRMPNINAALGCAQMEKLDLILANKRETALKYQEFFADSDIKFVSEPDNCRSNYWLNVILMPDKAARDNFLTYTNENDVMTRPAWQLMPHLPIFAQCQHDDMANALWIEERLVNLPSSYRNKR